MPGPIQLQNRSYYWEAIKQHRRTVALIVVSMITLPLFAFTSLPPIEVTEEIPHNIVKEIPIPVEIPVNVSVEIPIETNQTIQVEENITELVVVNETIGVNITEGGSIFLEPQPAPPLIGMDAVLCIDLSGSMDQARMDMTKAAIHNFLNVLERSENITQDRVALVTYYGSRDSDWYNDSTVEVGLDFIDDSAHLEALRNKTDELQAKTSFNDYWTDIWAGLNYSLDILLDNPRVTPSLKFILLLTDGEHNTGPWGVDVYDNNNYTGFLKLQPIDSPNYYTAREYGPNSPNPILQARANDVKIYSIGMLTNPSAEELLLQISENPENGTGGKYFDGDDTFNLTEAFIRARDEASGWTAVKINYTTIVGNGHHHLFSFNVTKDIRRLKWDLNWNDSTVDFNLTVIDPNGTVIDITSNISENIIPITLQQPKTIILDFPMIGIWHFNISWINIPSPGELIKGRLSSYNPPIFIESITQFNSTTFNESKDPSPLSSTISYDFTFEGDTQPFPSYISFKLADLKENGIFSNQSVFFTVNVTNKNPLYTYHNITPYVIANFTDFNVSSSWNPPIVENITTNETISFLFNLTFLEPTLLQGTIYFKVNCSEGYYDAVAQDVSLDYRVTTQNVTIETKFVNQTVTVVQNETIITTIISSGYETRIQTTSVLGTTNVLKYTYDRQVFDTLKWIGFFITLALLMSFLGVYIMSQAYHLKNLADKFRGRFFTDQLALEMALQREGITLAPADLSSVMTEADDLDRLGQSIYDLTGKQLSPEDLIRIASGTNIEKIAGRISYITGMSVDEIITHLRDAPSINALMEQFQLDSDRFLDIIARDEDVLNFQKRISNLISPVRREVSGIRIYDDFNIERFRSRLREEFRS
ncbi:MAG: VWA domain-containing protein [Promethearchaeota archaeon]